VQEDLDLAGGEVGGALAQVIQQLLAMLRPVLAGKLPHPQVGVEGWVRADGDDGRVEGETAASETFCQIPDPDRQPTLPAFQREPALSDPRPEAPDPAGAVRSQNAAGSTPDPGGMIRRSKVSR